MTSASRFGNLCWRNVAALLLVASGIVVIGIAGDTTREARAPGAEAPDREDAIAGPGERVSDPSRGIDDVVRTPDATSEDPHTTVHGSREGARRE